RWCTLSVNPLPLRPPHGAHLAAVAAAAEKTIAAVGLETRHAGSGRHLELLQNLSRLRIDASQIALLIFPGPVPKLPVDPGDASDKAIGLDGAKDRSGVGIDLMDLALPIDADPERSFGPGEPGVAAVARRRDRRDHAAGLRIDLLNAAFRNLEQMLAVES